MGCSITVFNFLCCVAVAEARNHLQGERKLPEPYSNKIVSSGHQPICPRIKEENGTVRKGEKSRNGIWIVVELECVLSNLLLLSVDSAGLAVRVCAGVSVPPFRLRHLFIDHGEHTAHITIIHSYFLSTEEKSNNVGSDNALGLAYFLLLSVSILDNLLGIKFSSIVILRTEYDIPRM